MDILFASFCSGCSDLSSWAFCHCGFSSLCWSAYLESDRCFVCKIVASIHSTLLSGKNLSPTVLWQTTSYIQELDTSKHVALRFHWLNSDRSLHSLWLHTYTTVMSPQSFLFLNPIWQLSDVDGCCWLKWCSLDDVREPIPEVRSRFCTSRLAQH